MGVTSTRKAGLRGRLSELLFLLLCEYFDKSNLREKGAGCFSSQFKVPAITAGNSRWQETGIEGYMPVLSLPSPLYTV